MKKKLALFFTVILAMACVLSGCGSKDKKTSGKKIGVIQMIENGAFNDMRDGILEEMKAKGYENVEVKCAQGDASALQTIAQNMADGSYDLVLQLQHHQHRQSLILKQRHLYFSVRFRHRWLQA